jgi:hypothetical protein
VVGAFIGGLDSDPLRGRGQSLLLYDSRCKLLVVRNQTSAVAIALTLIKLFKLSMLFESVIKQFVSHIFRKELFYCLRSHFVHKFIFVVKCIPFYDF